MTGTVFDIKEGAVHDGPGLRTTVFLKGCPLRCAWCHNPEGLSKEPQLMVKQNLCVGCGTCRKGCSHPECAPFSRCVHACPNGCLSVSGKEHTPQELCSELSKNRLFFQMSDGGVTFSGGEPLFQGGFLLECFDILQKDGINTAIETSGYCDADLFGKVCEKCSFIIMDIKIFDRNTHKKYTGVYNDAILENAKFLMNCGKPFLFRTPLIPHITDTKENLGKIRKFIKDSPWEKLKYNDMADLKYKMLGMEYPYGSMEVKNEN